MMQHKNVDSNCFKEKKKHKFVLFVCQIIWCCLILFRKTCIKRALPFSAASTLVVNVIVKDEKNEGLCISNVFGFWFVAMCGLWEASPNGEWWSIRIWEIDWRLADQS